MSFKAFALFGALLTPCVASAAPVETVFMNCSDVQRMAAPDIASLVAWLRVARGDSRRVKFFDIQQIKRDTQQLSNYCKANVNDTLPSALEQLFDYQ